ncbi:hypothetical protein AB0V79_24210 [Mesorhizobium ciceri]|nr:hypothetical protein [Mesorhizobium ciceri]
MRLLLRADGAERRNWLDLFSAPFDPSAKEIGYKVRAEEITPVYRKLR